jgi:hypothetical protein
VAIFDVDHDPEPPKRLLLQQWVVKSSHRKAAATDK